MAGKVTFRERMERFASGRNGSDELSRFLMITAMVILLASIFTGKVLNGILSSVLWIISLALFFFTNYRIYSKNIYKRQEENEKYKAIKRKIFGDPAERAKKAALLKQYKYFKCPKCKMEMRAPRGKGRIKVRCKGCGEEFITKT